MKKFILVNGVDVSKCIYFSDPECYAGFCKDRPNCYYKQFQKEKEKNAALNDSSRHAMKALNAYGNLNKKYYNALKQIYDETIETNIQEIARIAIYTGSKGGKQ